MYKGLAEFHLSLISRIIDMRKYPFTRLIMERNITNPEYTELIKLLEDLDVIYHSQREEGLLDFSSLLIQFAGMLNEKLEPTETIYALSQEGIYKELVNEFIKIIQQEENKYKRR
ncbi:DUF1878 family protein [Virgibacillus halodenitrificans]|uniref:DUF1878 family protein n=1 Tax=Virgibacillus halodenitrificans TaxID=1482 RepID=UPI000EF44E2E|nr:DUF1878 family protein [Virgibacillus halodenitrificans]